MHCAWCGHESEVLREGAVAPPTSLMGTDEADTGLGVETRVADCRNCGARVAFGESEISTTCVFCGAPGVLATAAHRNSVRPGGLVPLEIGRAAAQDAFGTWVRKRWFAPNAVRRLADLDATGVYVPYWLFDGQASSRWTAQSGTYHWVSQHVPAAAGRPARTARRREVRWRPASGRRRDAFERVPVVASKGIDERLAGRVVDQDPQAIVPYRPEFLSGWAAEEYQVALEEAWQRGDAQVRAWHRTLCARDVPGDTHRALQVETVVGDVAWRLVLFPLWTMHFEWKGKSYPVLVGGRDARVVGKAPTSFWKVLAVVLTIAAIVAAFVFLK